MDATLTLQLGQPSFRQGEVITLDLRFASRTPGRYRVTAPGESSHERDSADEFHVAPRDGVTDPLWDYFAYAPIVGFGGGGPSQLTLDAQPQRVSLTLNEWVRFDRPGRYQLSVTSHRLRDTTRAAAFGFESVPVTSNVVDVTITPAEPAWSARALAEASRALDGTVDAKARRAACRTLRFLGTAAAAGEMARRYQEGDPCAVELLFGLLGTRESGVAAQAFAEHIAAPETQVSEAWLWNAALLGLHAAQPERAPLAALGPRPTAPATHDWQKRTDAIERQFRASAAGLRAALPRKTGAARAAALVTLLEVANTRGMRAVFAPGAMQDLRAQVPGAFGALAPAEQHHLLADRWPLLRDAGMAPVLRTLVAVPPQLPWMGGEDLRTLALRRLHELAPVEAERLLVEEARRPVPRVAVTALRLLPEQAVAPLDALIVGHLEGVGPSMDGMEPLSYLVARYATPAVLPRVRRYYEHDINEWMCWQPRFIAYFLRVDPATGAAKLRELLDTPAAPQHPTCARQALGEVAQIFYSPALEQAAVAHLDDRDRRIAIDAAQTLGRYGSPAAERALWGRLERWHAEWQGRSANIGSVPHEETLGFALRDALAQSPGWLAGPAALSRLQTLCVTPMSCDAITQLRSAWPKAGPMPLYVSLGRDAEPSFSVAQYRVLPLLPARLKLAQLPRGSVLAWQPDTVDVGTPEEVRLFAELKAFLGGRGITLER